MTGPRFAGTAPRVRRGPGVVPPLILLAAVTLAAALAGCNRQPRFVPAAADSALAVPGDSLAEQVRLLQQRWAAGDDGAEAARLTAGLLLADLRVRFAGDAQGSWAARARVLLDSLGVGAETAEDRGALAVNFFSRGDPGAGSWPWLFWRHQGSIRAQEVEGRGMGLVAVAARGLSSAAGPSAAPGITLLFARRGGGGREPLALVWRAGERLELTQTLGPDSLGGVGSGAFDRTDGDSAIVLATRTWRPTPRFDECATCPHVVHERRLRWEAEGYARVEDRIVPSPYVAFVRLVQALTVGDHDAALACVARPRLLDDARQAGWAAVKGPWRVAPGSGLREDEMVFSRGGRESWRVTFTHAADGWRVESFAPATPVIE